MASIFSVMCYRVIQDSYCEILDDFLHQNVSEICTIKFKLDKNYGLLHSGNHAVHAKIVS